MLRRHEAAADGLEAEHEADEPDRAEQEAQEVERRRLLLAHVGDEAASTRTMPSTPIGTLIQKIQRQFR